MLADLNMKIDLRKALSPALYFLQRPVRLFQVSTSGNICSRI
jgi:hypothetical protein